LRAIKGNKTAATIEADIQRKTVWDWVHSTKDIKEATKRKVLQASLKTDLYGTIDFLVRKNATDYNEILQRCIYMIYENILSVNEALEFQGRISQFEKCIRSHAGAIFGIKTIPIEEMIDSINQKANSLGVEGIAQDINLISPQRLSQKFIHLLETFSTKTMFRDEIPNKLGLPKEFVDRAIEASSYLGPSSAQPDEEVVRGVGDMDLTVAKIGLRQHPFGYLHSTRK